MGLIRRSVSGSNIVWYKVSGPSWNKPDDDDDGEDDDSDDDVDDIDDKNDDDNLYLE